MNKLIFGIHVVQLKWGLVFLNNQATNVESTMPYEQFETLLFQSFTSDYIKKILEALSSNKKLLIDFDKEIVNLIEEKEPKFIQTMASYFSARSVENELLNIDNEDYKF